MESTQAKQFRERIKDKHRIVIKVGSASAQSG